MYLQWDEQTITDFLDENINDLYNQGFVFTRKEKGLMQQTRSLRINLSKFELNSENKRILRKTEGIELQIHTIPYSEYHWSIGKLAKDFYDTKFGDGTFSANKVKELLTDATQSNFNCLLTYSLSLRAEPSLDGEAKQSLTNDEITSSLTAPRNDSPVGYCICLVTDEILHYSYPFYNLHQSPKDMGLGMMTRAVQYAKEHGKKYIYLGSAQRPNDTYKLQFSGLEWYDGEEWQTNLEQLKDLLKKV